MPKVPNRHPGRLTSSILIVLVLLCLAVVQVASAAPGVATQKSAHDEGSILDWPMQVSAEPLQLSTATSDGSPARIIPASAVNPHC